MNISQISKRGGLSIAFLVGAAVGSIVAQTNSASAATFSLTAPITVLGTNETGVTVNVGSNFVASDLFNLTASGTVSVGGSGNFPFTNAAGVATTNAGIYTIGGVIGTPPNVGSSLLVSRNSGTFVQVFPVNAANGLGSNSVPTTLSLNNATLGSIFGIGLTTGDTLTFKIGDGSGQYGDNSGSFQLSSPNTSTSVPEPFTIVGTLIGGSAALRMRKKLKSTST